MLPISSIPSRRFTVGGGNGCPPGGSGSVHAHTVRKPVRHAVFGDRADVAKGRGRSRVKAGPRGLVEFKTEFRDCTARLQSAPTHQCAGNLANAENFKPRSLDRLPS